MGRTNVIDLLAPINFSVDTDCGIWYPLCYEIHVYANHYLVLTLLLSNTVCVIPDHKGCFTMLDEDPPYRKSKLLKHCIYVLADLLWLKIIALHVQAEESVTATVYMFRAICKFTLFRNCAAQIRNCEIANQFRNCVALLRILEIASFLKQTPPIDAIVARSARRWLSIVYSCCV